VKDFAKILTQDHSESYWHLSQLAAKEGVSIPKGIDAAKDPTIRQLAHLKGDRFDREFSQDEVAAHRRLLAAVKREAAHGQDAALKEFANKMIPVLEKHLELAEKCAKPAGKS
jgi:putative membrane protein